MTGISYDGFDESGGVNWYGLANVHLVKHETGLTLQVSGKFLMFVVQVAAMSGMLILTFSKRELYTHLI